MPRRIVRTVLPVDGVFHFEAVARVEGNGGLRVAIPAAIVRGLVLVKWGGRWLDVCIGAVRFKAAVRPHPTSVMFALPKRAREGLQAGEHVVVELRAANGPPAPRKRRVRGAWRPATPLLSLPWLR
jgi:hypothetical protein